MKRILFLVLAVPFAAFAEREFIWPDGKCPMPSPVRRWRLRKMAFDPSSNGFAEIQESPQAEDCDDRPIWYHLLKK